MIPLFTYYPIAKSRCNAFMQLVAIAVCFLLLAGCSQQSGSSEADSESEQFHFLMALDTLKTGERLARVEAALLQSPKKNTRLHEYLQGVAMVLRNKPDSVIMYFEAWEVPAETEWDILRQFELLSGSTTRTGIVSAEQTEAVFSAVKAAESLNSRFTYRLYDIFAMINYNNGNVEAAISYTDKYFNNHPYKRSNFIRQRYHDISFLLNERRGDLIQMDRHFRAARDLALKNRDSLALMRTYEYESQLNLATFELDSAVRNMKKHLDYAERNQQQLTFMYSNIANLYYKNGQTDSARYYYEKSIDYSKTREPDARTINAYRGLSRLWADRKDYGKAYLYLDSMLQLKEEYDKRKRDEYIEQLQAEYAVERKDKEIENLTLTNNLSRKIIAQERWTFGIAIALLVILGLLGYMVYRRSILYHHNKKLEFENKSLLLEQRLTQMQINPHFIHNAIANLQGLIIQDEKKTANRYLVALSKLIRNILELNRRELITIEEEMEALENYLKLQKMRMKDSFDYTLEAGDLETDAYVLPPMLLQPFIENAIEHGFANLPYRGELHIRFNHEQEKLHIRIEDNGGKGFASTGITPGKKSLSQTIIQERLDLLFNQEKTRAWYEAGQKPDDSGYRVDIYLPLTGA